jgi:hypothetical protein
VGPSSGVRPSKYPYIVIRIVAKFLDFMFLVDGIVSCGDINIHNFLKF